MLVRMAATSYVGDQRFCRMSRHNSPLAYTLGWNILVLYPLKACVSMHLHSTASQRPRHRSEWPANRQGALHWHCRRTGARLT